MAALYITADDGTGNIQTMLVSDYLALFPSANVRTANANFDFLWNGVTVQFITNTAYVLSPDMWAALQTQGLPIS